jgi:hypothetical protein
VEAVTGPVGPTVPPWVFAIKISHVRLFLMATWKSGLGNFSGTNLSHVTMGGNLLH